MTYAYTGKVLLPVTVTPPPAPRIKAHANGWCASDICVPEEGDFRSIFRRGTPGPSAQAPLFAAHRPSSAAALSLARGGRTRWDAVRARARADPRHRGRRLVHPR